MVFELFVIFILYGKSPFLLFFEHFVALLHIYQRQPWEWTCIVII